MLQQMYNIEVSHSISNLSDGVTSYMADSGPLDLKRESKEGLKREKT